MLKNGELLGETAWGSGRVWVVGLLQKPEAKSREKEKKATLGSRWPWQSGHELQRRACSRSQQNGQNIQWAETIWEQQRRLECSLAWAILGIGRKSPCPQCGMNGRNGVQDARSVRGLCSLV